MWVDRVSFTGLPIEIRYQTNLLDTAGNDAHASAFIRQRLILLDEELFWNKTEHRRVLLHEIFHFAWVRLGNPTRLRWEALLRYELRLRAPGETGWSSEWRKLALREQDITQRGRAWREYCCESFCDTAAWVWGGDGWEDGCDDTALTLTARWRKIRGVWFDKEFATRCIAI